MNIIEKKLSEIKPYDKNPRRNDKAVRYVANSIKEFGFKVPVVVDKDGVIVCGHTRYKAAKRLGLKTIPCVTADDLSEEQIKAFRIADNKVSEIADWDMPVLTLEMDEIKDLYDFSDFGFDTSVNDREDDKRPSSNNYGGDNETTIVTLVMKSTVFDEVKQDIQNIIEEKEITMTAKKKK